MIFSAKKYFCENGFRGQKNIFYAKLTFLPIFSVKIFFSRKTHFGAKNFFLVEKILNRP